ncbi:MAG: hypothetical protein AABY04_01695 [Candidatus Micrarchaeota archaeon]
MKKSELKELDRQKKANSLERLKFIDLYVKWIKKTPNKVWSKTLAKFHDGQI